jgi:hypothetical protein
LIEGIHRPSETSVYFADDACIVSTPGSDGTTIEVLPTSAWPAELMRRGYHLEDFEGGQRILTHAIHEPMAINPGGSLGAS